MYDEEDATQEGLFALASAIVAYDPTKTENEAMFYRTRIRQRIIDGYREVYSRRGQRIQVTKFAIPFSALFARVADLEGDATRLLEKVIERTLGAVDPNLAAVDHRDELDYIMRRFTPEERRVLRRYVADEISMKMIGKEIGLSESRVSQMFSKMREHGQIQFRPITRRNFGAKKETVHGEG